MDIRQINNGIDKLLTYLSTTEAIYTFIGGLKPCSVIHNLKHVERTSGLILIELVLIAQTFNKNNNGINIYVEEDNDALYVLNKEAYFKFVQEQQETLKSMFHFDIDDASKLIKQIDDYEDNTLRCEMYGYLFGYPKHAVDFFCYGSQNNSFGRKGIRHRTQDGKDNFVYVVPEDHIENEEDKRIRKHAEIIFNLYQENINQTSHLTELLNTLNNNYTNTIKNENNAA